ncbi:MAG TPA: bacteriocin [Stellaceae bacterium]|nr:bacteriocin [Stellaceae bacterium]
MTGLKKPQPDAKKPHGAPKKEKPAATAQELSQDELKKIVGGAISEKKGA